MVDRRQTSQHNSIPNEICFDKYWKTTVKLEGANDGQGVIGFE